MDEKIKKLKELQLNSEEKAEIRQNLVKFMTKHPVSVSSQGLFRRLISNINLSVKNKEYSMPAIIAILVIALSGGTAFAAEGSLPGDPLYPVKTSITEPVAQAFYVTGEAKANYKINLVERRLNEAEKLAASGKLNAKTAQQLELSFEKQEERFRQIIEKMEEQGNDVAAAQLSSRLEAVIEFHNQLLIDLEGDTGGVLDSSVLQGIKDEVSAKALIHTQLREKIEAKIDQDAKGGADIKEAAEGRLNAASNKLEEVGKYIAKHEARIGTEAAASAQTKLTIAQNTFTQALTVFEQGNYAESFALAQKSHRQAQQAKLSAATAIKIKIAPAQADLPDQAGGDNEEGDDEDEKLESDQTGVETQAEIRSDVRLELNHR